MEGGGRCKDKECGKGVNGYIGVLCIVESMSSEGCV